MNARDVTTMTELMDALVGAFGSVCDDPPRSELLRACRETVDRARNDVEEAFCRADWRAYREWARAWTAEFGVKWEPCDAWHELDEWQPWFDEPDPGPFVSRTWKRLCPGIFDHIGVEGSSIYDEDDGHWRWEYEPENLPTPLPLPAGAQRLASGGFRSTFSTLEDAIAAAEKYVAECGQ